MKNMKKLLQRAMVFTLSAAMLVGTPMTASAAGLVDLYSISDGTNNDITDTKDVSHTGTVTNTYTGTDSGVLKDNYAKIIGIVLDEDYVNAEVGKEKTLTATVVLDSNVKDEKLRKTLENLIKWQVLNADGKIDANTNKVLSISAKTGERTKVTLNPRQGTEKGKEMIVRATIDGNYYAVLNEETGKYEVKELVDNKAESYTADAKVYIKQYTESLDWKGDIPQAYVKHTLDLSEYLQRTPETANDEITWSSSDTKVATVTAAGVVTFKKVQKKDESVTITAVSEKGATAERKFTVGKGTPASKVEIYVDEPNEDGSTSSNVIKKTADLDLKDSDPSTGVKVRMYAKVKAYADGKVAVIPNEEEDTVVDSPNGKLKTVEIKDGDKYIDEDNTVRRLKVTDDIAWTSNRTTIATVAGGNTEATITAAGKALGTASITAKASNGKSAKVSTTVKATLTKLEIGNAPTKLYSGQSVTLEAKRTPELNKDAVKWTVTDATGNKTKDATINAKGVLTIKPKLSAPSVTIKVKLETTKLKGDDGKPKFSPEKTITIEQSSINGFAVYEEKVDPNKMVAEYTTKQIKKGTSEISVPKDKTYVVIVGEGSTGGAESLAWKSSSEKIAKVVANSDGSAKITAVAKGNATITVSGVKNQKAIKATFKVAVSQPTTSLTMNKTLVVLKDTNKNLSQSFSVKQNKNAKETIAWNVYPADKAEITTKGKVTIRKGYYKAGDVFTVTATSQSGVTAKATIQIVTASAGVKVEDVAGNGFSYVAAKNKKTVDNATTLELGKSVVLVPKVNVGKTKPSDAQQWIDAGTTSEDGKAAANVTYSANKKGIVQIIGNTVYRVGNGSVTITVKTADGKSYKLKIDDPEKAASSEQ